MTIEDRLDRQLPEITLDAVGLGDAINFYRDITGARIKVDWQALSTVGIGPTTPVTTRFRNVRTSKSLDMILDSVGGGQIRLAYIVEDGTIQVSTVEALRKRLIVRTYDIDDLVAAMPGASIVQKITTRIARSSWLQHGGSTGVIVEFGTRLVVLQTPANHRAIAGLLQRMAFEARSRIPLRTR